MALNIFWRSLSPEQKRFIAIETAIPCLVSGLIPVLLIWLGALQVPVAIWGAGGLPRTMIMPTVAPVIGMVVITTLLVRVRVAKGDAPSLAQRPSMLRWFPDILVMRALLSLVVPMLILLPLSLLLFVALCTDPSSAAQFAVYNFVYGVSLAIITVPPILIAAMVDGHRGQAGSWPETR